jgi:hypothetical protein
MNGCIKTHTHTHKHIDTLVYAIINDNIIILLLKEERN